MPPPPLPVPDPIESATRFDVIDVAGSIATDTAWNADTVRVVGDVTVEDGVTLTIAPGVRVEFQDYYRLEVAGTLLAVGTPGREIVFTTDEPQAFVIDDSHAGAWNGIRFETTLSTNAPSRIAYSVIEYSKATVPGPGLYPYAGGAISVVGFSKLSIDNCVIRHNVADYGGAFFLYRNADVTLAGNLVVDNHALEDAGAYWIGYSFPKMSNNTMVRNVVRNADVPFYATAGGLNFLSKPVFTNNVFRDNDPEVLYQHFQLLNAKAYHTRHNNIEGYETTGGNLDADPLFLDPDGLDDLPGTPDDDFRLQLASPGIDGGLDAAVPAGVVADRGGAARFVDGDDDAIPAVDMGAHEFPQGNVLSFAPDHETLTWPVFGGAQAYRIYRGDLVDLLDLDGDGLPDDGYGLCLSPLDPDPGDTVFIDVQLPDPGAAFFYLMSVVDDQGDERFLGATSAGQPRFVLSPCSP